MDCVNNIKYNKGGELMCLADIRSYNESARKETEGYCHWKYEDYDMNTYWQTECDNEHCFIDDDFDAVEINGYKFCPYCGKKIKVVE